MATNLFDAAPDVESALTGDQPLFESAPDVESALTGDQPLFESAPDLANGLPDGGNLFDAAPNLPDSNPIPDEPVSDWLGIGEEVSGLGNSLARGAVNFAQQQNLNALRRQRDIPGEIAKIDAELKQAEDYLASRVPHPGIAAKGFVTAGEEADYRRSMQRTLGDAARRKIGLQQELARLEQSAPNIKREFQSNQELLEALPYTEAQREFQKKETPWWKFFQNPVELTATTTLESAPVMAQTMAAAPLGPGGVVLVAGGSSFGAESSARVLAKMQEDGVDLKNPESVVAWLADRAKSDPALAKADLAALGPATFDALSGGIAGRWLKGATGRGTKPLVGAMAKESGAQMLAGGAGSIAGNKLAGEAVDWKDVVLEMAAEVAPAEAVSNVAAEHGFGLDQIVSQRAENKAFDAASAQAAQEAALQGTLPVRNGKLTQNRAADFSFEKGKLFESAPNVESSEAQPQKPETQNQNSRPAGTESPATPPDASAQVRAELEALPGADQDLRRTVPALTTEQTDAGLRQQIEDDAPVTKGDLKALVNFFQNGGPNPFAPKPATTNPAEISSKLTVAKPVGTTTESTEAQSQPSKQMPGGAAVTAEVTDGAPIPANGQEAATVNPPANPVNANPKELEQRKSAAWDEVQKLRKRLQKAPKNQSVQMALQKAQKAHAAAVRAWKKATGQAIATGTRAAKVFAAEEEMGGEDILSFIIEQGGLVSKSSAKRHRGSEWWQKNKSLYDDAAPLARTHHNIVYSDNGRYPDQLAQAAYEKGLIDEPHERALWAAMKDASGKRANAYKKQAQQEEHLQTQSKFASATAQGDMAVTAEDLKPGDTFEVDGEPFKVKRVDPTTGEVTLDDGKVFGRQYLSAGQQIWVEQPSDGLTERIADADGGAQFAAGESQKIQFARVPGKWGAQKVFVDGKHRGDVTVDFKARTATLTVDGKTMSLPSIEAAQSPVEFVRRMLAQSALPNRGEEFSFDAPESVAEQKARERREKQQADTKAAKESMLERAGARLVADEDTRTGDMFASPEERSTRQDKAGQGSLFKAGSKATGTPRAQIQNVVAGLQREMPKAAPTTVVNTPEELPAAVRSAAAKQGVRLAGVKGLLLGNRVYLVASNLANPAEAQSIWLHEQVGHFATDATLGAELRDFMGQVHDSFKGSQLMADVRARYPKADRVTLGREVVARLAEAGNTNPGAFKRLLAMFRAWLRKLGLVRQVSENDLRVMLQRAAESLRDGSSKVSGLESKVSKRGVLEAGNATLVAPWARGEFALTAHHGTPHKVDKFTTAKIGTGEGAQVYGWGLYFAENEKVAASYAETLSERDRKQRSREGETRLNEQAKREGLAVSWSDDRGRFYLRPQIAPGRSAQYDPAELEARASETLRAAIAQANSSVYGNKYTVSLNVEPEELLDWDKPLREQSARVRKAIATLNLGLVPSETGNSVYAAIKFGPPKESNPARWDGMASLNAPKDSAAQASATLSSLGIKGIRFLDQGSRNILPEAWLVTWRDGRTPTRFANQQQAQDFLDGNKARGAVGIKPDVRPTYNYVIFNDEDITITHENGKPVSVAEAVPGQAEFAAGQDQTKTEAFKKWFGNSKVVDSQGNPLVVYHQTSKTNEPGIMSPEGFSTNPAKARARISDEQVPNGIFFKPDAKDIGLTANAADAVQIPVYLSLKNPLRVEDRAGLKSFFVNESQAYWEKTEELRALDARYSAEFDRLWKMPEDTDQDTRRSASKSKGLDTLMDKWKADMEANAAESRAIIDDILKQKGYDGVIIANDAGSFGRKTKTYIVLDSRQVKSATVNSGEFNPDTPDIRFAAGEAEQSEFAKLQADITAAEQELMEAIRQTVLPPDQRQGTRKDVFAAKNDAHRKLRDLLAKQLKMMTDIRNLDAARSPEETANLISQTVDLLNSIQDEISERTAKAQAVPADLLKLRTDLQERLMMLKGWTDDQSEAGRANVPKETEAGRARFLALESATDPQHKTFGEWWQTIKNGLRYLTSPIPELPLTGERAEKSALFRRGYRLFAVENNRVRKEAAERVNEVLEPLTKLGRTPASNEALRRYYKLGEARERAAMDQKRRDELAKEMLALEESTLNKDPFNLFRRLVLYKDLRWRGTYLKNEQGKPITLPMGLTVDEVASELRRTYKLIEQHPDGLAITEALRRHYKLTDDLQKSILEHGEIIPESLRNPLYFPHHVIDSWSGNIARVRPSTEEDFRKYLIAPTGSAKLIQTDYLKAMYLHTADVLAHNARVDLVDKYWKPYDISEQLKAQHGDKWNLPWNIPPGYKVFTPFNKLPLRMDYVLSREVLADKLGVLFNDGDLRERMGDTGKVLKVKPEDLHAAMVAGEKIQWVLPAEIADALTGIARREAAASNPGLGHAIGLPFRAVNNFWKKTKLFAPWNWVRYEYGNLSTDAIDKVLAADPGAAKHLARAAREIWTADTGEQSPEYQAAQREGVFDTITAGEAGELTKLPEFKAFLTGSEARWEKVRSFLERPMRGSKFREAVFRYAKFLADVERLRSGKEPVYAGAFHGDIEALGEDVDGQRRMLEGDELIYAKAAEISLKTYGDYNSLGVAGQLLRQYAVPFWSWQDVNFRYHANQLRNIADGLLGKTGPELNTARKAALRYAGVRVVSTLLAIGIAKELWNQFGGPMLGLWDDDDDLEAKLSEADRRRGHLIVGKDKDGKVLVVYTPSAWSDVAEWMGGQNMKRLFMEYVRGQITLDQFVKDYAKQMPRDVLNKLGQSLGPLGKAPYEAISGKSTFPDVLDQRTIPESERWWRLVGTLTDDRAVNVLRGAFDHDYYSQPAAEQLQQIILQIRRRDPEQWSYYEAREDAADWKEARTGKRFEQGSYDAPEAQALRNFRKSIYRGDVASAERFYGRLLQFGYTAERLDASIRNQHPLSDLNETERAEYIKTLSQKQRQELELATKYYNRIKALDGRERQLFPRKGQKPNPRPELLKQIVEGQSRNK